MFRYCSNQECGRCKPFRDSPGKLLTGEQAEHILRDTYSRVKLSRRPVTVR